MLQCSIREFVMTTTTKKPRAQKVGAAGKVAPKAPRKVAAKKPAAVKKAAPAMVEPIVPEPVAFVEPTPAPELTAADLVPAEPAPVEVEEEVTTEIIAEPTVMIARTLPAIEAVSQETIEAVIETEEWVEQKGTEIMNDVMETTKKFAEEAKTRFESAFSEISEKAKVGVEKSSKAFEEFSDLAKGNVEAIVESGKIATKGVETMGQDAAEYGRVTFEKASAALKSFAAVKTPAEFFQLQSELLSSTFDAFAKETAKNSEAFLKLAGDVAQPISSRVSIVTEKVRSIAA